MLCFPEKFAIGIELSSRLPGKSVDMAVTSKTTRFECYHRYLRLLKERENVPKDAVAWFLSDRTKTAATIPQDVAHDAN